MTKLDLWSMHKIDTIPNCLARAAHLHLKYKDEEGDVVDLVDEEDFDIFLANSHVQYLTLIEKLEE